MFSLLPVGQRRVAIYGISACCNSPAESIQEVAPRTYMHALITELGYNHSSILTSYIVGVVGQGHCCLPLVREVVSFTFRTLQKVSKTIANLSTGSLDAVRVLVYALVKEYARP
jgi:hypothetical protein